MKSFYHESGLHYRQEMVKCRKPACKRCPHGPYWYAYSRSSAYLKKTYVGKNLSEAVLALAPEDVRDQELGNAKRVKLKS